jgi:hypothetical protein
MNRLYNGKCCEKQDEYDCVHNICPGCYCDKEHDANVCNDCHQFNLDHQPYLDKFGADNVRASG